LKRLRKWSGRYGFETAVNKIDTLEHWGGESDYTAEVLRFPRSTPNDEMSERWKSDKFMEFSDSRGDLRIHEVTQ
jgi:hypothetical protein